MVIAIIGILASLLLPALGRARSRAQLVVCTSNLRQLAIAGLMYAGDANGYISAPMQNGDAGFLVRTFNGWNRLPEAMGWWIAGGYIPGGDVFYCPVKPASIAPSVEAYTDALRPVLRQWQSGTAPANDIHARYILNPGLIWFWADPRVPWRANPDPAGVYPGNSPANPMRNVYPPSRYESRIPLIADYSSPWCYPPHQAEGYTVAFMDGHVRFFPMQPTWMLFGTHSETTSHGGSPRWADFYLAVERRLLIRPGNIARGESSLSISAFLIYRKMGSGEGSRQAGWPEFRVYAEVSREDSSSATRWPARRPRRPTRLADPWAKMPWRAGRGAPMKRWDWRGSTAPEGACAASA